MGSRGHDWRPHLASLSGFALVALAFTWPLPLHLSTHFTGAPTGDTGVYVWNQWVFHREVDRGHLPYFTDAIFSTSDLANLSLHNYTTFHNLLALPLQHVFGVATSFNLVFLAMMVVTAYAGFLLARELTGQTAESWLAALLFGWCPALVTRGTGHFSLASGAPLAIFALLLVRSERTEQRGPWLPLLLGATLWWAASTDAYYGIYCLLMAAVYIALRVVRIERRPAPPGRAGRALDAAIIAAAALIAAIVLSGGWQGDIAGQVVSIRSLHTPVLIMTLLVLLRLGLHLRPRLDAWGRERAWRVFRVATIAGIVATVMLAPRLFAVWVRIARSGLDSGSLFWRSGPSGVDLLGLLLPNPNHPLAPAAFRAWLSPRPDAYIENVASLAVTALVVMALAWRTGWRPLRVWGGMAIVFGWLALGPFIQVAGLTSYVPAPWALLRYLPLVGLARTPARFSVLLMLAFAMLFALALTWLGRHWPARRVPLLIAAGLLLVVELLPAPRQLFSAEVPSFYAAVAAAPANSRVLELPFGVRDGTASDGNFTARSQYFQTMHGKLLIGGYLSRVSTRRRSELRSDRMLDALMLLSEGRTLPPPTEARLRREGPGFIADTRVSFVVIDTARTAPALRAFAQGAFGLTLVQAEGELELYRPAAADPPMLPSRRPASPSR